MGRRNLPSRPRVVYHLANGRCRKGGGSAADFTLPLVQKSGPTFATPGGRAHYAITLTNLEAVTHTMQLTETLPATLAFIPTSNADLIFDPHTRQLTWQGAIAPGHLDYTITEAAVSLPYLRSGRLRRRGPVRGYYRYRRRLQ